MKAVRIGVIGLGGMSRYHMKNLVSLPNVSISAICDVNAEAVREVGDEYGVPADKRYDAVEAIVADPDVDGIVSVTPNDSHAAIFRSCIEAGKPLLAEKPLTRTFAEAKQVLSLYRSRPIVCLINFSYRNGPAFQLAKKYVSEGRLGRINHLFVQYFQEWGSVPKKMPFIWRYDEAVTGTGTLGDLGSHMLDLVEYVTGSRLTELQSILRTIVPHRPDSRTGAPVPVAVDDFACWNGTFADGAVGVFQTSRNALGSANQHELTLYGDLGTLHVSTLDDRRLRWTYASEEGDVATETIEAGADEGLNPWKEFADRIRGAAPNPEYASLEDGYRNQLLLEAVVQAHRSRSLIEVDSVEREGSASKTD